MYNFIKSYTKYLQVYIRGLCHLYEVLLYVKKVARIRNRSFRIRFQVFVYVKKCASTKWCLYEVKSPTDEHDLKTWGSRSENLPVVQNNMLSADRSTVLIKSDPQYYYMIACL